MATPSKWVKGAKRPGEAGGSVGVGFANARKSGANIC